MKQHLAILLWATDPELPHLCATPFFHAAAAAAMDIEVEIYFASKSVFLLVPDVATTVRAVPESDVNIYQYMRQAAQFGARFVACSEALAAHGIASSKLIPEVSGFGGATAFVGRVLDPDWATLCY